MEAKQQPARAYNIPTEEDVAAFGQWLVERESTPATVEKYLREAGRFVAFLQAGEFELDESLDVEKPTASADPANPASLTKLHVIAHKQHLVQNFSPATANVGIVAVNAFLKHLGAEELCVKRVRVQQTHLRGPEDDLTLDDYQALRMAARRTGDVRGLLVLETLCSTGIRVSELSAVTVAAARLGVAQVSNKGKVRAVWLPHQLSSELLKYARAKGIGEGPVLMSEHGRPLDRTTVWRIMKRLAREAGVDEGRVYPHNLRHLFATVFYEKYRDLDGLSAILGHSNVETTRIYVAGTDAAREVQINNLMLCG